MLHAFHASIVNNENYYKSITKLDVKVNDEGNPIALYGKENELTTNLFNNFPLDMNTGDVDIISLEDNILMMIRDRGYALSVQIEMSVDKTILAKYFIPKICNIEMVNTLKGVNKVDKNSRFTTGDFITNKEKLSEDIINLISGIPMDKDMLLISNSINFDKEYKSINK